MVTEFLEFLEVNPQARFFILQSQGDRKGLGNMYSLYSTAIKTSFRRDLEGEEIEAVTSVMGAMIFAKEPLNNDVLIMLPGVKIPDSDLDMLQFIQNSLTSVIDKGPIFHFHHCSFEDFVLSFSFSQDLPEFAAVQDQNHHEHQLAMLCLNTMALLALHFNICGLKTLDIRNRDIPATNKSAISPLLSYSCQFWADHLVCTPCEQMLMELVQFVMYDKLLFWMEVMSISGRAHKTVTILKRTLEWSQFNVCCSLICHSTYLMLTG